MALRRNKMIIMFLMSSALLVPMLEIKAQMTFKERIVHCASGVGKLSFALTNCFVMYYAGKVAATDFKNDCLIWPIAEWDKVRWPRKEAFLLAASVPSLAVMIYASAKSGIRSLKKAFEKELIQKR